MADDWWRQYQSGDTQPWDRDRWPDPLPPDAGPKAVQEAERIIAEPPPPEPEPVELPVPDLPPPEPRAPVDPVRALRLYVRHLRDKLRDDLSDS